MPFTVTVISADITPIDLTCILLNAVFTEICISLAAVPRDSSVIFQTGFTTIGSATANYGDASADPLRHLLASIQAVGVQVGVVHYGCSRILGALCFVHQQLRTSEVSPAVRALCLYMSNLPL